MSKVYRTSLVSIIEVPVDVPFYMLRFFVDVPVYVLFVPYIYHLKYQLMYHSICCASLLIYQLLYQSIRCVPIPSIRSIFMIYIYIFLYYSSFFFLYFITTFLHLPAGTFCPGMSSNHYYILVFLYYPKLKDFELK